MPSRSLPPHVLDLIDAAVAAVAPLHISYAIGGGVALYAHGYRRHTDDVDLFINEEDRGTVLRALRENGLIVSAAFPPYMYIAKFPDETDPDVRIDVLIPTGDPEISAIEMAKRVKIGDSETMVFNAELLALSKFYSDRPEDHRDLQKMWESGLFDIPETIRLLGLMDTEETVRDFRAELESFKRKKTRPRPPRRN